MPHLLIPMGVAIALFGTLALAHEAGYLIGRRARGKGRETAGLTAVQGAMLGLLGLLLAFSYAGAAERFGERQELLVREVNAVGTLYLRADLLDEPARGLLKGAVRDYVRARLELYNAVIDDASRARLSAIQDRMWEAAREGVAAKPHLGILVLPAVNEVMDLFTERNAAVERHLPGLVLGLLIASAVASIATVAYGFGLSGGRHIAAMWGLVLVIACSLWMTIDLDYPQYGLIRMSVTPLEALRSILAGTVWW